MGNEVKHILKYFKIYPQRIIIFPICVDYKNFTVLINGKQEAEIKIDKIVTIIIFAIIALPKEDILRVWRKKKKASRSSDSSKD